MGTWQDKANREWGTTATWIKGDGQYAVLHPCGGELTVTLCTTPIEAKAAKAVVLTQPEQSKAALALDATEKP